MRECSKTASTTKRFLEGQGPIHSSSRHADSVQIQLGRDLRRMIKVLNDDFSLTQEIISKSVHSQMFLNFPFFFNISFLQRGGRPRNGRADPGCEDGSW